MSEIQLTGLHAETPIGFLATLGAFRHATQMQGELGNVRLRWRRTGNRWFAALVTEREVSAEALLSLFTQRVCELGERLEFAWADQIKKNTVERFREVAKQSQTRQDWFAAFGSELALSQAGTVQSTDFDMTGGQQKFLLKLRELSTSVSASPEEALGLLREALFGPWLYAGSTKPSDRDNSHSMGLDSSTVLQGAFSAEEPAEIKDKRGVRGAIWLGFEALPLFPCVCDGGSRLRTTGFTEEKGQSGKRKVYFEWGVWGEPLTMEAVKTLLLQSREEWTRARGIHERFRSERVNMNKDYYSLAAAELIVD